MTAARATHACAGGCRRQVPSYHFACPDCWWRLPSEMRDQLTATHGRDPAAHVEAMLSAIAWYREELPTAPISDHSSVPVERTAVPADPPWPRVVEGRCSWCGDPESEHDGGVREHHRIEIVGGRYDDEPEMRPCLPAPVDPESPGVIDADLVAVIADRLHGCVTPTPSGWVTLAGTVIGEQLVLTVTTWGPLSAGMPTRTVSRPVLLGQALPPSRDEDGPG